MAVGGDTGVQARHTLDMKTGNATVEYNLYIKH
uniref:Uncharacterized protein n=1 Tax=Oryza brachyantha TaxID=4533 RepID=J3NBT1_ORYBR